MNNFRVFTIKYHGATNTRGDRVSIYDNRFKVRVFIPYDYTFNTHFEVAENYLCNLGINLIGGGEGKGCYFLFADDFNTIFK